jgi:hypothetical protein
MTVKGATGTTITVPVGASAWLFCDGTNVRDALGYYFGSTATAFSPATNNTQALGTTALQWADLFLASGGVINFDNGDVTITEGADTLAFAGAASGYTFSHVVTPAANDGAALGTGAVSWSDLFLASGGVINFNNGNYTLTHSAGVLTANGALSIGTGNALTAGTIELGAAADTTISRGAGGFIAVEGNRVPSPASQASGDILYRGATEWERLAKGTASQVLTMNAGATAPEWATAAASNAQIFSSSGTWTKPPSGNVIYVRVWAGGGSGGRAGSTDGGGGGGGGAYAETWLAFSAAASTETVTVGAGGAARTVDEQNGVAGGNSSFGSLLTTYGGGGGGGSTAAAGSGGGGGGLQSAGGAGAGTPTAGGAGGGPDGGVGGTSGASPTVGGAATAIAGGGGGGGAADNVTGRSGGLALGFGGGGGGGGANNDPAGTGGNSVYGGGGGGGGSGSSGSAAGGNSVFGGLGGAGSTAATAATAGAVPGGGGGGSENGNSGAGGNGRVEVYVF